MSTQDISLAAAHVVGQTNEAAKTLVSTCRDGMQHLLDGARTRGSGFVRDARLPLASDAMKARLIDSHEQVNGFVSRRLDADTARLLQLMDRVAGGTARGIDRVARMTREVDSPLGRRLLDTLAQVQMPLATLSVRLADQVAEGARRIEGRVLAAAAGPATRTPHER